MDGRQGIGKSRFVSFLGSPLPAFFIENPIDTNDKDYLVYLCSKWIWEVGELEQTFKKSDLISLKHYLSTETVNVRKAYGEYHIEKPATASFIGTLNDVAGFLADPTGHRRYRVCQIKNINWAYEKEVNINQIWAQAVTLLKQGETPNLSEDEQSVVDEINSRYEQDDPLLYSISKIYDINPEDKDSFLPAAEILQTLKDYGAVSGGYDKANQSRIAGILTKLGCEASRKYVNGVQMRVWHGVKTKCIESVEKLFDQHV
jgi:predicted P-loop ATPase